LKSLRNFSIPFTGLKLGKHQFEYIINDAFFDEFEYSLVKKADLNLPGRAGKTGDYDHPEFSNYRYN
jgi:hypothetical protein